MWTFVFYYRTEGRCLGAKPERESSTTERTEVFCLFCVFRSWYFMHISPMFISLRLLPTIVRLSFSLPPKIARNVFLSHKWRFFGGLFVKITHYFAAKLRHYMQCHFGKNDFNFGKCDFFRVFENSRGFRVESRLSISPDAFGGVRPLLSTWYHVFMCVCGFFADSFL